MVIHCVCSSIWLTLLAGSHTRNYMRAVFRVFTITFCIFFSFFSFGQDKVVKNVLEMGKTDNRTMVHADYLANIIGGRPVGSHNLEDAEKWVASQFKSWGLEVMVQEVGELNVGFSRGPWSGRMIGGEGMNLHFVTPTYSPGTRGPQKGNVYLEPQSQADFDRIKGRLKGAWVLIGGNSYGSTLDWTAKGDEYRAKMKAKADSIARLNDEARRWNWEHPDQKKEMLHVPSVPGLFCQEMKAAGVLGFIQAADIPMQAHYDRTGYRDLDFDNLPRVCDIKLERAQYDAIKKMVLEHRDFQLEFDIRNHFFPGPVKYHNVIGIMKGTKWPDEYVLMGGHLDSYDVASGAVDDANGVCVTMEAARLLAASGAKPKRTIMFCIWTGEEYGLLGSKFFVESKTVPLEKISNYFNRDGGPLAVTGVTVPEAMYEDFEKICEPVIGYNDEIPFTLEKRQGEPQPRPRSAGGSDHAYFAMSGVPVIHLNESDIKGYDFNYRVIWHTESDNFNMLYPDYLEHSAPVSAAIVYGVANLNHILSREGLYADEKEPNEKK